MTAFFKIKGFPPMLYKSFLFFVLGSFSCNSSTKHTVQKKKISKESKFRVSQLISNGDVIDAVPYNQDYQNKIFSDSYEYLDSMVTGLNFKNSWNPKDKHKLELENSFISAGVAIGDFNNDGLQDIFLSRQEDGGRLFKNLGSMQFEDVTENSGILDSNMWSTGASFIDINNDGWLDLYVCGFDSPNKLYINDEGIFKNQAKSYGLDYEGASVMMAFAD